ncbi:DUF1348 family protein [Streptomyces sp. NPDC058695]|uniref:DUF1348 family protein n=1 Tax=Streptomyces sp. NPDC058695 TaxID=3346604 RepID=UPI003648E79A
MTCTASCHTPMVIMAGQQARRHGRGGGRMKQPDPHKVSLAYAEDSRRRNRSEFFTGREEIVEFLTRKWEKGLEYRLIQELWTFGGDRIAVRFAYESRDTDGNWFRPTEMRTGISIPDGLMAVRHASINDVPITEADRKYHWPLGRRPDGPPDSVSSGSEEQRAQVHGEPWETHPDLGSARVLNAFQDG